MNRHSIWLTILAVMSLVTFAGACAPLLGSQNDAVPTTTPASAAPATTATAPTSASAVTSVATTSATTAATSVATMTAGATSPATTTRAAFTPATGAVENLKGQHVSVLGVWSGVEFNQFQQVVTAWEEQTGGKVDWEGTRDMDTLLTKRVRDGNPPDIAVLPNPGLLRQLAQQGKLLPLDSFMDMNQIHKDYSSAWINLGSSNGKLYAIFYRAINKETVWYNPQAFGAGGYTIPKTWNEWIALADKMVADGKTPFSIATESGPGTGWSLTDWISEIVLNNCGADIYDSWVAHEIPWTDACIKQSFQMLGTIVGTKGYALGGAQRILATNVDDGGFAMYTNPPRAYMDYLGSFEQSIVANHYPNIEPVRGYNFFLFPTINPQYQGSMTVAADALVMFNNTPAARSFMSFLAGAPAQSIWVKQGGFLALNNSVPLADYPDPIAKAFAQDLINAKVSRFGAGDAMPFAMQQAWWKQMVGFVRNPSDVDSILNALEATAKSVYH